MVPLLAPLTKKVLFHEKCGKIGTCHAGQLAKLANETPFSPILFPSLPHPAPLFHKTLELLAAWLTLTGLEPKAPAPSETPGGRVTGATALAPRNFPVESAQICPQPQQGSPASRPLPITMPKAILGNKMTTEEKTKARTVRISVAHCCERRVTRGHAFSAC